MFVLRLIMKKISILLLLIAAICACKKYEKGPNFSLKSKKSRVANNWQVESFIDKGIDKTSIFNNCVFEFSKDNGLISKTPNGSFNASWEFDEEDDDDENNSDNKEVEIKYSSKDAICNELEGDWTIIRLKENEFWLRDDDDLTKEIRFKEKE